MAREAAGTGVKRTRETPPGSRSTISLSVAFQTPPGGQVAEQHRVELQHDVRGEGHVLVRLVDEREGVAVAGDLLLGAVWRGRLQHDGFTRPGAATTPSMRFEDSLDSTAAACRRTSSCSGIWATKRCCRPRDSPSPLDGRELRGVEDEAVEVVGRERGPHGGLPMAETG